MRWKQRGAACLAELESAQSVHKTNDARYQNAIGGVVGYDAGDTPVVRSNAAEADSKSGLGGGRVAYRHTAASTHRYYQAPPEATVQIDHICSKIRRKLRFVSRRKSYTCTLVILPRLLPTLRAHMAQQA